MKFDDFWKKMYRALRVKKDFTTLYRETRFSAHSENNNIIITLKKNEQRNLSRENFKEIWNAAAKLPKYERYRPGNYSKITFHSSYAVTLLKHYLQVK